MSCNGFLKSRGKSKFRASDASVSLLGRIHEGGGKEAVALGVHHF